MPVVPASPGHAPSTRGADPDPRGGREHPDRGYELFRLWCELTGRSVREVPVDEVAAFLGRREVRALSRVPAEVLRDAAGAARRGSSLPVERWLATVRIVRPHA
ncbi:hypothetical protein Athai_41640 [Actinocatenispora thailandica]|uniref:Uncharacterized protein n=1 Tax=Actinocatenispora thailandica TaxID=227318 RepID=A0A7R7DS12_9ACTN|nr:hypothetical protein [Actinocatenispora thailandica]BCJ36661.1 hypothetical protein Athai_41640 [Actinocatenispora thailandica]